VPLPDDVPGGAQVERAARDENWAEPGREMGTDVAENCSLPSGLNSPDAQRARAKTCASSKDSSPEITAR
jgi:hypothetical protein